MSKLYRVPVVIHATAYVKADSDEDALQLAKDTFHNETMEVSDSDVYWTDDIVVSGRMYGDPELPDVSLSPAMTLQCTADLADVEEDD